MECTEYALILLVASLVGGSYLGAVVRGWGLSHRVYSLEIEIEQLKGIQTREVKLRAAAESVRARQRLDPVQERALEVLEKPQEPPKPSFWWMPYVSKDLSR